MATNVMGLAPYGTPKYTDVLREIVLLQSDGSFKLSLEYFKHSTNGFLINGPMVHHK